MTQHFKTLLEGVVADADQRIGALPLLTASERHRLLVEWNDTATDYPQDRCIHQLFAEQVARTPDATAVVFEDERLSYGELDARANRLAHHLRGCGVGPEVVVGLCLERSPEMVIGLLAILKAGGAYLPLDPDYPSQRLSFMLKDAGAPVLVTHSALAARLPSPQVRSVLVDADAAAIAAQPTSAPALTLDPHHPAYVIYTSGSTGTPKGVARATHQCRCILDWAPRSNSAQTDVTVSIAFDVLSAFDLSIFELFACTMFWTHGRAGPSTPLHLPAANCTWRSAQSPFRRRSAELLRMAGASPPPC